VTIVPLLGWYFPDSVVGGNEVYVEGLCRRLRAAGYDVLIAAPDSRHVAPEHDALRQPRTMDDIAADDRALYAA
jgi:hypothetical protein